MTVIAMTKARLFTTAVMLLAAGCAGAINGDGDIGDDLVDDPPEREEVATIDAPDDGLGGDAFIPRESPPDVDTLAACLRTVDVAGSAALAKALAGAQPGDCLLLADGTYTFPTIDKKGTEASPIFVRAAHTLKVVVASGSLMLKGAAFVEV